VLGTGTAQLWVEVADFLREALPDVEEARIDGVGHLLHLERPAPVAHAIAEFLGRHPMT
jgi:pimeloyl-ACP methyl ester carboxylesterase